MLMFTFPFYKDYNRHDKSANAIIKPLDELGWDRVKRIFSLEYVYYYISKYKILLLQLHT